MAFKEKKKDIRKMGGDIAERLNEKYGQQVVYSAKKAPHRPKYKIPWSSLTLNRLTGGGATVPRMAQLFGPSSVYKSTGIYDLIANAQRMRKEQPKLVGKGPSGEVRRVALIDAEKSMSPVFLKNCGIDIDNLDIIAFESADQLIDIMVDMMLSDEYMLICLDSITVLLTEREKDTDAADMIKLQGWQGKFTSNMFRKVHDANRGNTAFVFVNQIRDTFGDKIDRARNDDTNYTPTGGHAPQFYPSETLELTHYMQEREAAAEMIPAPASSYSRKRFKGWIISVRVHKTRSSGQDNAELFFRFVPKMGSIDYHAELVTMATIDGIITNKNENGKATAFYYYIDAKGKRIKIAHGADALRIKLASDEKLAKEIRERVEQRSREMGGL